jgi:hypothetical protein
MHVLVGLAGGALIGLMLAEFFVAFMLPRRVKRDPRIARGIYGVLWRPWQWVAGRLSPAAGDTMLGFFGPLALLLQLAVWALGLMIGFACLQWAFGSHLNPGAAGTFGDDLYFSSGDFLSAGVAAPVSTATRAISLLEAATGIGVLFIVIGYLPSVYQAFSRREVAVSQLVPRAGSSPSAAGLLDRVVERGGHEDLVRYLREWEVWAAELMETHLSYPILAYYRSQHVSLNWLAALTTIVDTSAVVIAAKPEGEAEAAELTYAIGQHAFADLAHQFHARPHMKERGRLSDADFAILRSILERGVAELVDEETMRSRLDRLRHRYEPYALALAQALALSLPDWVPERLRETEPARVH